MRRMPIPFYLVAIEFLLFDVEIMFLLPYALVMRELGLPGLAAVGIFVSFIIVGFVYALKIGTLNWSHTSPGRDAMEQHTPLRPPIGIQRVAGEAMS